MSSQPGLGGRGLTIRQQGDDPASFQLADDTGVSVIAPPGPVIDADDLERIGRRTAAASDDTQERVLAYWQHQPFCKSRSRSTAKRQTQVMDDKLASSLAVRRADGANIPSAKRSVKIWRPHRTASQRKRRAITRSSTTRPDNGRSVTRRRYRLWIRRETVPHDGHKPTLPDARTAMTALSPS
ncbi:hypothetical protein BKD09_15480 [Bradyrhizobium japonicum]|uniref:Uncharacterized protein n=1 Tax=Bradyrhizobium japonicum TaxID=375 RepID=A0A1L3F8U8_BRAJP|nr:hypothetical protein BKD09_15480 [Bradyrhizobium japonicum]